MGELPRLVIDERDGQTVVADHVDAVRSVELDQTIHERLSRVVLEDVVGEGDVLAGGFYVCEYERVVVHRIAGVVDGQRYRAGVLLEDHGEQRQGCTYVEVIVRHLTLDERISDVQIVLSLVPQFPVDLTDDLVEVLVDLGILGTLGGVAQLQNPLPAEEHAHDIDTLQAHQVECVLAGYLPLEQQTVAPADVYELLLQLPQCLGGLIIDVRSVGSGDGVLPGDVQELLPILLHEPLSDTDYGGEILHLGGDALSHLPEGLIGAYVGYPAVGHPVLRPQPLPELV